MVTMKPVPLLRKNIWKDCYAVCICIYLYLSDIPCPLFVVRIRHTILGTESAIHVSDSYLFAMPLKTKHTKPYVVFKLLIISVNIMTLKYSFASHLLRI